MPLDVLRTFNWQRARDWAAAKDPKSIAGNPGEGFYCPLARCFNELEPGNEFLIGSDCIYDNQGEQYRNPPWLERVADMIDKESGFSITIARFREILDLNRPISLEEILHGETD